MNFKYPFFSGRLFFGVDESRFIDALTNLVSTFKGNNGIFFSDNLITWSKRIGWVDDAPFVTAMNRHAETKTERGIVWRTSTLAWAARHALRVPGDFVECGCYKGTTARILCDIVDLAHRKFYIYDLFEGVEGVAKHALEEHGPELYETVKARFKDIPQVVVTKGRIPDSFSQAAPDQISFLHVDMNNTSAEIAALETLFDRVSPGGVIILDDYGWLSYHEQHALERQWFADRGYSVLELPTGQGMVIK